MRDVEQKIRRLRDKAFPLQTRIGKCVSYCTLPLATSVFVLLRRTKLDAVFTSHWQVSLLSIYYIFSFFISPVITLAYEEWILYCSRKRIEDGGIEKEKQLSGIASTDSTADEHTAAPGLATVTFPTCLLMFLPCSCIVLVNQVGSVPDATWDILSSVALILMVLVLLMASAFAEFARQASKPQAVVVFGIHTFSLIAAQYLFGTSGAYPGIFFARLLICMIEDDKPIASRVMTASMWLSAIAGWYIISTFNLW